MGLFFFRNNSPSWRLSGSFLLLVSGRAMAWRPMMKVIVPNTNIGRMGWTELREAMYGADMEPSLAMEHATDSAADLITVGKSSLV